MSGNPTTPSNVVPMPTNWPGPMFTPKTFPPGGPSCFSELAALNACYDSIQMMNQILSKVITDLVTNDPAVQKAIVEAIAASGSNVPLIGVTNGTDAQPGQVGEWFMQSQSGAITGVANQTAIVSFTQQPGDWDVWAELLYTATQTSLAFELNPQPAGISDGMSVWLNSPGPGTNGTLISAAARLLTAVPVLLPFQITFNEAGAGAAGNYSFSLKARRRR